MVIGTDCIGTLKSNFHTITTTTAPTIISLFTYRNTSLHVTTNETDSGQIESQYDEIDSTSYQSVHYTLDDNVSVHNWYVSDDKAVHHSTASDDKSVHHSTVSDDKTVHHSTANDDKTVDHTLHIYEDVQEMEDEHHWYLQIITPEEYMTYTKDNISWNLHFTVRCGPHVNYAELDIFYLHNIKSKIYRIQFITTLF
jgi:hypothetical protein